MDDFGLTMDELLVMDGIARRDRAWNQAATATMEKLERLGMMARDWPLSLPQASPLDTARRMLGGRPR